MDFEALDAAIATIEAVVRDLEPGCLDGRGAVRAVKRFARAEHACAAGKALAATRVEETVAYRQHAPNAVAWLAVTAGMPVAQAERALRTAQALGEAPGTDAAFRAGRISAAQAQVIAAAVAKDPGAEAQLVADATAGVSFKGLQDRARRVHALAEADDAAWAQRLEASRSVRTWVEADGGACGSWRLAPDRGAEVDAAIRAEVERRYQEARTGDGEIPSRDQLAADALHGLVTRGPRQPVGVTLVMDAAVADQGHTRPGQRCEIPGIGPIPVTIARRMLAGASVRTLPQDPALLPDYESEARRYPAWMLDWLAQRYPTCGQPGCDTDHGLQIDHVLALADGGTTHIHNLWRLCWYHHDRKTNHQWRVVGTPHAWELVPPDDPDPP